MKKTLTVSIAGQGGNESADWARWERVVIDLAVQCQLRLTHAAVYRSATPNFRMKMKPFRSLHRLDRKITRYSLASVPPSFVTITQDAKLYAHRWLKGLYVTIAVDALPASPLLFVKDNLPSLRQCLVRVQGQAAFVLAASELAVNYADGANDIRECRKAKVLFYEAGGFLLL